MMVKITAKELRRKYRKFFEARGHKWIPSASLLPENDSTTLFVSAGIQPLVPYFLGEKHPFGSRLVNVQKCVRTGDIGQVGDTFHHTFFEMLGNWSLGDYFKKEMISWSYRFLTSILNINSDHLHITCFLGGEGVPRDAEAAKIWQQQGVAKNRIHFLPKKDNWWGPPGVTGPCGPDSEMFIDTSPELADVDFAAGCKSGRYVEVWNDVFIQYFKNEKGEFKKLKQNNIDTGMGVERTLAVFLGLKDNYLTNIWQPVIKKIEEVSGKSYEKEEKKKPMRIIADHLRSAVFIIAAGVSPSNKEQGYVLRRLIRRAVRQGKKIGIKNNFTRSIAAAVLDNQINYAGFYPELDDNRDKILQILEAEEVRYQKTGRGIFKAQKLLKSKKELSGEDLFFIYETYGTAPEMIEKKLKIKFDKNGFQKAQRIHQQLSRTAAKTKFKGGLLGHSSKMIQFHTATHLLRAALQKVLNVHVHQMGSNITEERLRFDFTYPRKLTQKEIASAEKLVNQRIKENLPVNMVIMSFKQAVNEGAEILPTGTYPDKVKVYSIGNPSAAGRVFSKEVCGGPHVKRTGELGRFKIIKEKSCGSGKRRIYAMLE